MVADSKSVLGLHLTEVRILSSPYFKKDPLKLLPTLTGFAIIKDITNWRLFLASLSIQPFNRLDDAIRWPIVAHLLRFWCVCICD